MSLAKRAVTGVAGNRFLKGRKNRNISRGKKENYGGGEDEKTWPTYDGEKLPKTLC